MDGGIVARAARISLDSAENGDPKESSMRIGAEQLNPHLHYEERPMLENVASVEQPPAVSQSTDSGVSAFIAYASDNARKTVEDVYAWLKKNKVEVLVDFKDERLMMTNVNEWLNKAIEGSDFVIVCIDRYYKRIACEYTDTNRSKDQEKSWKQYVFDAMQALIINQGCRNYNFLPLLIDDANFSDLPIVFQSSKVYWWPKDKNDIINRVFRRQRYTQPEMGSPPVAEFRRVR